MSSYNIPNGKKHTVALCISTHVPQYSFFSHQDNKIFDGWACKIEKNKLHFANELPRQEMK